MRMPAWRVALTGGAITVLAITVLAIAGIGLAAASSAPSRATTTTTGSTTSGATTSATTETLTTDMDLAIDLAADVQSNDNLRPADGGRLRRILRLGRHLVHADVTVTDRDGNLVHLQLDHGTVQSIGDGTLVIAESGGGTEIVSTSDATKVHVGREPGGLGDVKVGAEIVVQSRIDGGTTIAKRIIVIPSGT
jgi:hypothetical protein